MLWHAEAGEDADFYYNEEEVQAGARGKERAAMLDHYDSLLQVPGSAEGNEVGSPAPVTVMQRLSVDWIGPSMLDRVSPDMLLCKMCMVLQLTARCLSLRSLS